MKRPSHLAYVPSFNPYGIKAYVSCTLPVRLALQAFAGLLTAVLVTQPAWAQTVTKPVSSATSQASSASTQPTTPAPVSPATAAPRYSAKDAKLAFGFLDANGDGKISREEAARAKNVAKYFDRADVNRDKGLSLQEFVAALNKAKVL